MTNSKTLEAEVCIPRWASNVIKDNTSSEIAITGGYGSAKTFNSWVILLVKLLQNRNCKTAFFTEPVHHLVKSVAIKSFEEVVSLYFKWEEGKHYKINRSSPAFITLKITGQQIILLSTENPDRLVGFKAGLGVIDEAGSSKKEARERLLARLREKNIIMNQLILPSTPEGINYYAEIYDSDTLTGWKHLTPTDHIFIKGKYQKRRIRILTEDNQKYLPDNYINQIKETYGHNPNYIKSYLYGLFAPFAEGLAIANYNPKLHDLIDREAISPKETIFLSWDWNANPLSWVAISVRLDDNRKKIYTVHDESELKYSQIPEACIEFSVKYPLHLYKDTDIFIDGDPSGFNESHKTRLNDFKAVEKELKNLGYQNIFIQATNKKMREIDTIDTLNRLFYENRLFLNPYLKELKKSLITTKLKTNARKLDKPNGEDWTHKIDAVKYLLYRLEGDIIGNFKNQLKGFNL